LSEPAALDFAERHFFVAIAILGLPVLVWLAARNMKGVPEQRPAVLADDD
jgi:hypothetical protein